MENKLLTYSSSPHIKAPKTTKWIMINVCISLLPAIIAGIIFFGLKAYLLIALSVLTAFLSELLFLLIVKKPIKDILKEFDFTSIVTGLLVALSIGTNYPIYSVVFGSAFAIIVVKMLFGGTGKNLVNPAVTGRIFIFISFQAMVTPWLLPMASTPTTGATNLELLFGGSSMSILDLFLGTNLGGCIGETCKLAILIGGIYLAVLKIINIIYPLITIAVSGLFAVCLGGFDFSLFLPFTLSGGLIFGAIFMATDYTTTPNTKLGNIIYFIMLGLLVTGLRFATKNETISSAIKETISFAILLMNLLVPLIDKFIIPKPFGYKKPKKEQLKWKNYLLL